MGQHRLASLRANIHEICLRYAMNTLTLRESAK
jgi:hypothetical protein